MIWPAVAVDNGKRPTIIKLVNVRLQLVTDEEVKLLNPPSARRTFNQLRFVRWCHEAYAQNGVLTLLDLSLLSGLAESYAGQLLRQYDQDNQTTTPTRGAVHDLGRSVTHKAEVVRRYLRGESPADIAHILNHSQHAVDAYIRDYEVTRKLIQKFPLHEIPALSQRALSVIKEHIDLIRQFEPSLVFYSEQHNSDETPALNSARLI